MQFNFASKSYGTDRILDPCAFSLEVGKVTALLGPSGVGKTTLLRMIAGLEADDSGAVESTRRVSVTFQEPRLMPWLTVKQNVELVAPESGWLERLGLAGKEALYPRQLSLGMARRAALARALAFQPELLVLDEPFASLDTTTADQVRDLLRQTILHSAVTTLLVTHDENDVSAFDATVLRLEGRPAKLR